MLVAFRCDASLVIGTGHVMRCLTLAAKLRDSGAECVFLCRAHPGKLDERIQSAGHKVVLLPPPDGAAPQGPPEHAGWVGVPWQQDVTDTCRALSGRRPDWLVIDHYGLDSRWHGAMRPQAVRIMVIDDLADRPLDCDLLLDQNLGRQTQDYAGLVPETCRQLIGPQFALLRPEFAARRAGALLGRHDRPLRNILITMGGVDAQDVTSGILRALQNVALPAELTVTVVMGGTAPALGRVKALAKRMPWPTEVVVDVTDMAARMEVADLAIGAAGSTTWERCVMGLPSIILQIAENQSGIARAMIAAGAALDPGHVASLDFDMSFSRCLRQAQRSLQALSERSALICDGDGTGRVVRDLILAKPGFRPATLEDSHRIWTWRAASALETFSASGEKPDFADHHAWFTKALKDPLRSIHVLMLGTWPCGYVRLDRSEQKRAKVSVCLAPDARGEGLAASLLSKAADLGTEMDLSHIDAVIHVQNVASLRCFERAGYTRGAVQGAFADYHLSLSGRK